jgi:hypothetical protein
VKTPVNKHLTFLGRDQFNQNLTLQLGRHPRIDNDIIDKRMLSVAELEDCARTLGQHGLARVSKPDDLNNFTFSSPGLYLLFDDRHEVYRVYTTKDRSWRAEVNGGQLVSPQTLRDQPHIN